MRITKPLRQSSWVSMSIAAMTLAMFAGLAHSAKREKSPFPPLHLRTLASAKVQLCKGLAENSVEFYMKQRMPEEYKAYERVRTNEFETDKQQSLRALALQKMRDEAATEFDPAAVYEADNRLAYLSAYQFDAGGFEVRLPSGAILRTTYFTHMDGRRALIDLPDLYGLKELLDSGPGETQALTLNYAYTPSDSDALSTGAGTAGAIFIKIEEARARTIVAESQDAPGRRILADIHVRIERCDQSQQGRHQLFGRILGFKLHTAKLSKSFFETEESWKPISLIAEWRSPSWPQSASGGRSQ